MSTLLQFISWIASYSPKRFGLLMLDAVSSHIWHGIHVQPKYRSCKPTGAQLHCSAMDMQSSIAFYTRDNATLRLSSTTAIVMTYAVLITSTR